jgi:hypothetical protein
MTTCRGARIVLVGSVLVLLAACGGQADAGIGPGESPSSSVSVPDGLAVRVEHIDGFAESMIRGFVRTPILSVYGDGRVIAPGPQIMIYPPPALPNLQLRKISKENVAKLVDMAIGAGVGSGIDMGRPQIEDAPLTRFTVRQGEETKTLTVDALAETPDVSHGLTKEQVEGRKKLQNLLAALTNLPETFGRDAVGPEEPYAPTSVAAVVSPWAATGDGASAQPAMAWPGPQLPGAPVASTAVTCLLVSGTEMTKVLDAAKSANLLTPWTSGGGTWRIVLRPLLPDEPDCAALQIRD